MSRVILNTLRRVGLYETYQTLRYGLSKPDWWESQRRQLAFFAELIRPGDLVFDVGANEGEWAYVFWRLGAQVVCFEPQAGPMGELRERFDFRRYRRITLEPVALGADEGTAKIAIGTLSTVSSMSPEWVASMKESGRGRAYAWDDYQEVSVTTLDRMIERHGRPRFLKIDVEGYESEVLSGLTQPVHGVSFEFTPELLDKALSCVNHLCGLGSYRFNLIRGEEFQFLLPDWVEEGELVDALRQKHEDAANQPRFDIHARLT